MKPLPLIILLFIALGCATANDNQPRPQAKNDTPQRILDAEARLSQTGVVVKNTSLFDIPSLTLKLNLTQLGQDDGQANAGSLPKGKTITIPYSEFTVGTARFNPRATKILTVYVKSGDGSSKLFLCPGPICQAAQ